MIVRTLPTGEMLMLTQTDHSRLAGTFAAHWGNATFAAPAPYESVARAAAFHDFGYMRYETAPHFDPDTGGTPMFRSLPTNAQRLEEYAWCFDWLLALDPYASVLTEMHRNGLWQRRYGTIASAMHKVVSHSAEVAAFIARYEAQRPELVARYGIDPKQLWTNYRLLQVWDLMSLYFSCQEPYDETIEPVPTSYADADGEGVTLRLTAIDATTVALDPYPFDVPELHVALAARRLAQSTFPDEAAFRKAYFRAPVELLSFDLVPATVASRERVLSATA